MKQIENQSALIWTSSDVKVNAQRMLTKSEQDKLYEIIGESDDDLKGFLEKIIEENEGEIISFINEIICESIKEEIR